MFRLVASVFMGWSLGSNATANAFGTAVFSKTIRYRTAIILAAVFIILGAFLEGREGMETLSGLVRQTRDSAFIASLASALTVFLMTVLRIPVPGPQAAVGAILGIGLVIGRVDLPDLTKIVACWITTPILAMITSAVLYPLLAKGIDRLGLNIFTRDYTMKIGLLVAGSYAAYALGANNVANVTGVFINTGQLTVLQGALLGGASIALGSLTYSKNVMKTVGRNLVKLDPYSALVSVLSMALVAHFYAKLGVPVSTSQGIIGSVLGIGLVKGIQTINPKTLFSILMGWLGTPLVALVLSFALFRLFF